MSEYTRARPRAADLSLLLSDDGVVLEAGESLLALTGAEINPLGMQFEALLHPGDRDQVTQLTRATGETVLLRLRARSDDWEPYQAWSERWVGFSDGVLVRLRRSDTGEDVDELVRRTIQMQAVARLAGRMAHEFNNLFTEVQGHVWRLMDVLDPKSPAALETRSLRDSITEASTLTRQLLAYTRQQVLEPRVIDMNRVVDDLLPTLRKIVGAEIEVTAVLSEPTSTVRADANQLEQIVIHVVENARDAMPHGGLISIQTSDQTLGPIEARRFAYPVTPGRYVRLTISDTGHGMSPDVAARVFEPFFTTHGNEGKPGLGMSSTYGIVKQSGGYVWVESEVGVGTSISIYLPYQESKEALDSDGALNLPALRTDGPATILIVEDNPGVRSTVVKVLMRRGFGVLEASDGREALRTADGYPSSIDLLLTDVMMPHMDGRELVENLRKSRPEMRVLFMSGYAQEASMRTEYFDAGDSFIAKPFEPDMLVARISDILGQIPRAANRS
jgi:two-component system, cell cycle sensor histidine kinase and response regulator CckA